MQIPFVLLTGFLGSGKTTLVNRFLHLPKPEKLGIVVNEFGSIGIDKNLMGDGNILELSGGCVCCATGNELWESGLTLVDEAGATHVIMETSGVADPVVILQQFKNLPENLAKRINFCGVICVVDVLNVKEAAEKHPEVIRQIQIANQILLSKIDVASSEQLLAAHQFLDSLQATSERTALLPSAYPSEISHLLTWIFSSSPLNTPQTLSLPLHSQLSAVSVLEEEPLLAEPFGRLLIDLAGKVWRAKGFVRLLHEQKNMANQGGPSAQATFHEEVSILHVVGSSIELSPCTSEQAKTSPKSSTLVFIGENLDEEWVKLRLAACRANVE